MASSRTRQRKLERDRYERKLVRLAQKQRRRRQINAGIGAFVALALIVVGTLWLTGVFDDKPEPADFSQPDLCTWLPRGTDDPNRVDVGTPPANPPTSGQHRITVELDAGDTAAGTVEVQMDVAEDPCGAASLVHLAEQGFYDGTTCHELADGALRCGDPSGTGLGGPTYAFWADNIPVPGLDGQEGPLYPAGTVAFGDAAGENGSQFLIFYEDYDPEAPVFPIIGTVTSGLDVVEAIGAAGTAEESTAPAAEVKLTSFTVSDANELATR